jgi:DNA topoisomerase-6 subunit B
MAKRTKKKAPRAEKKRTAKGRSQTKSRKSAAQKGPETAPAASSGRAARRRSRGASAGEMARRQREISISEFFTKNRHLLGFDNPHKALLTTVKEGVDNSLDACEEADILPELTVRIEPATGENRYRVIMEDNGPGIVRKQIPRIFGKLLYGSKFHRLKMSRGQQGIGISAAGMYGHLTTGNPTCVLSRVAGAKEAHYYEIVIDTKTNEPRVLRDEPRTWEVPHGTRVTIELEATYRKGRLSVDEYLEETAIANPHVSISYFAPDRREIRYERLTDVMPEEPREIRPHPYGIELGMLIKMLHDTKARRLSSFLQSDFSRVSARVANEVCQTAKLSEKARPSRIAREEAEVLLKAIRNTRIMNPPLNCVSPIGEEQLLAGLKGRVPADFYTAITRNPTVYRGNPFLVEAAIAYGGQLPADGTAQLYRLANRVPLLYQAGACVITQSVNDISWKSYGLQQATGGPPLGSLLITVHLASVWVPFTSESKEAIAGYPEIEKEIKLALQECGRRLAVFLRRRHREAEEHRKRSYIEMYIPCIGEALQEILEFGDKEKTRIVDTLTDVLEKSRKR